MLFLTYTTLALPARGSGRSRKAARLDQVIAWAVGGGARGGGSGRGGGDAATTWDGVIVFDECHKSKGLRPGDARGGVFAASAVGGAGGFAADDEIGLLGGGGRRGRGGRGGAGAGTSSKVALAVVELQNRLPSARVLYTSATGLPRVRSRRSAARREAVAEAGLLRERRGRRPRWVFCPSPSRRRAAVEEEVTVEEGCPWRKGPPQPAPPLPLLARRRRRRGESRSAPAATGLPPLILRKRAERARREPRRAATRTGRPGRATSAAKRGKERGDY